jgi:hypothetical protein
MNGDGGVGARRQTPTRLGGERRTPSRDGTAGAERVGSRDDADACFGADRGCGRRP